MEDKELLLSKIPENQGLGNNTAKTQLGWDDARYTAAKSALIAEGLIRLGPGKGGSIKRTVPGEPVKVHEVKHKPAPVVVADLTGFVNDEDALLSLVPEDGQINNRKLQHMTGWDDAKFVAVKKTLLETHKIVSTIGGPGGASRRFRAGETPKAPAVTKVEPVEATEETPEAKDPIVISAASPDTAVAIIARLKETGYPTAEFYVAPENGEFMIKIRRRYAVPMNPEVRDRLAQRAHEAAEFVGTAAKETPAKTEEAAVAVEAVAEKAAEAGA